MSQETRTVSSLASSVNTCVALCCVIFLKNIAFRAKLAMGRNELYIASVAACNPILQGVDRAQCFDWCVNAHALDLCSYDDSFWMASNCSVGNTCSCYVFLVCPEIQ